MAARKIGEAERLARHNAEMRLALRDNLSLAEARHRLARERYQQRTRCGTDARETVWTDERGLPIAPPQSGEVEDPQYWWLKL